MTSQPDARVVRELLARAHRRLTWAIAARGAAAGFVAALLVGLVAHRWPAAGLLALVVALAALGAVAALLLARNSRAHVAALLEARVPASRNLIITADELFTSSASGYVPDLVVREAARVARSVELSRVFPIRGAIAALVSAIALWLAGATLVAAPADSRIASVRAVLVRGSAAVSRVDAEVAAPAYVSAATRTVRDPSRVEALQGSTIKLNIDASADRVVVETIRRADTVRAERSGFFTQTISADADGYIALQPIAADGTLGARRLIGLSVTPDAPPRARITTPGRDLFLKDPKSTIDLVLDANDDIGLAALRLRYTKVSGSGERCTFTDGDVPLSIAKRDTKTWTARATWPLATLGLEPGDMVVYRAVATDARPGAAGSESDSYIAEIVAPGGVAAAGFSLDPDQERYAVSQQMVILKSERLIASRASLSAEDFATTSQEIAIEQRKVRAEFVFMLGGELADAPALENMTDLNEEAEAAGEGDLLAGRNANAGHLALTRAIRAMSRASTALNVAKVDSAMPYEREALKQLESAFSRARIILRALTERERLDMSRRLTGSLNEASRDVRPVIEPERDAASVSLRRALATLASIAGEVRLNAASGAQLSELAQRVLQVNPSLPVLQSASTALSSAASSATAGRETNARAAIDQATTAIANVLRSGAAGGAVTQPATDERMLRGALTDALRARGAKP
jgi:hypothetical protein